MAIDACALGAPMARSSAHTEILLARAKVVMVYVLTRVERRKTTKKTKSKKKMKKFKGDSKETPLIRQPLSYFFWRGIVVGSANIKIDGQSESESESRIDA